MSKFTIITTDGDQKTTDELTREELFLYMVSRIQQYIDQNQFSVITKAGTGVGKSVNFMYELFKNMPNYRIICTQPTILNAVTLAQFLEKKYNMQIGHNLGIQTGPQKISVKTTGGIIYATMGSVISKYLSPFMQNTDRKNRNQIIVIDEAHSNQIDYQIALSMVRFILKNVQNPPFFIIQSASINLIDYATYFNSKQLFEIIGAQHTIIELYLDDLYNPTVTEQLKFSDFSAHIVQSIISKTDRIQKLTKEANCDIDGDILIFVPGKQLMESVQKKIQQLAKSDVTILCLSREELYINPQIKDQVNQLGQKVIISTNIAETGITFEHATYVIDCMKFKSVYYDPLRKSQVSRDLPICRNMMQQRRGRVGRIQGGLYFGAIKKADLQRLMPYRERQIQISDLKPVISQLGIINFNRIEFITQIPDEIQLDAIQGTVFVGLEHCQNHPIYNQILVRMPKLDLYYKLLLYISFIYGLKLCQMISLVVFLSREQPQRKPMKPLAGRNDFLDIINHIESTKNLHQGFCTDVTELLTYFNSINISIFKGIDVRQNVQLFNDAISRSFQQYVMHQIKIEQNQIIYQTDFGLQLRLNSVQSDIKNAPKQLITNGFINQFQFQPLFIMDNSKNSIHYFSKCKQGIYKS